MIIETSDKFIEELQRKKFSYRLLALDLGEKKIGLATVNSEIRISTPIKTIARSNTNNDFQQIADFIVQNSIDGVVIGLPLSLDGQENEACRRIRKFANALIKVVRQPITFHDERFTTSMADSIGQSLGLSRKQRNKRDDQIAASLILESFIKKIY
jgi:putative Holliday junction resolvase